MQAQSFTPLAVLGRSGAFYRVVVSGHIGYMDAKLVQTEDAELETDAELYQWIVGSDAVVQQVGRTEADVEYDEHLSLNVQYPRTDCAALDDALKRFVWEKEREARDMLGAVGVDRGRGGGRIIAQLRCLPYRRAVCHRDGERLFDEQLYGASGGFGACCDRGFADGKLLTADDILTEAGKDVALKLLTDRLSQVYGAMDDAQADESWLSNCALLPSGVAVVFVRGDLLPSALGTLRVILLYAELGAAAHFRRSLILPRCRKQIGGDAITTLRRGRRGLSKRRRRRKRQCAGIDPDKPMIALTFDDGPSEVTPAYPRGARRGGRQGDILRRRQSRSQL